MLAWRLNDTLNTFLQNIFIYFCRFVGRSDLLFIVILTNQSAEKMMKTPLFYRPRSSFRCRQSESIKL